MRFNVIVIPNLKHSCLHIWLHIWIDLVKKSLAVQILAKQ